MSHSTVTVVLPAVPEDDKHLHEMLSELLAPFDENTEMDPYHSYVDPPAEGWEIGVANMQKFAALQESGLERAVAWKQVWGEENKDARLEWPRSLAVREGSIDPADDAAVAAFYNTRYGSDTEEKYYVDEGGLYSISTYNPDSTWDWWALGGRWSGFYVLRDDPQGPHWLGNPGTLGACREQSDRVADCCARGDVDVLTMTSRFVENQRRFYDDVKSGKERDFYGEIQEDEIRESYVARQLEENYPWRTFAVLAEGRWRDAGRMGWFGVDASNSDTREDYREWFQTFWSKMPDGTYLAVVDVHI